MPEMQPGAEVALLLHGLGRTSASMRRMHRRAASEGFRVIDWSYASFSRSIDEHVADLQRTLGELDADPAVARIHFVTHSLGGIITRKALLDKPPAKMGRVVMLAPPNRGSRVARRLAPWLGRWIKPLADLSNAPESAVNRLGVPAGVDIGIIAARHDGKVRVEDTHLPGEADHLVVSGFHTFLMNAREVQDCTIRFLRTGRFRDAAP
jgi:pimeloyl-ACP methyl ester carboxylesterase